jgi:predicted glycogen debranching enzyme
VEPLEITFGPQTCTTLEESAQREWLVTDGRGGYAMGTVSGLRTRRYHALLVVSGEEVSRRNVALIGLDPVLVVGDRRSRLAVHEWTNGVVDPPGHEHLVQFALVDGVPRWRWQVGAVVLEREVAMANGTSAVGVTHRLLHADRPVRLELTALCTWRDAHGERTAGPDPAVAHRSDGFEFEGHYRVSGTCEWQPGGEWYLGAHWREEAARGLNSNEDVWAAGRYVVDLEPGEEIGVVAAALPVGQLPPARLVVDAARQRCRRLVMDAGATDAVEATLAHAADQLIVARDVPNVVAGYPWFGTWSRDTMISYEGLFIETGRADEGRRLLAAAGAGLSDGMLPNTADTGTLEYNTADATLWFVHAVGRHVERTKDGDLADELVDALDRIVQDHVDGTRYGLKCDPADGLLSQGADGMALTWMDARVDGVPVTQRAGKAVEICALWIAALATVDALRERTGGEPRWAALRAQATDSFATAFGRPDGRAGLLDLAGQWQLPPPDAAAVRPNQLFALSLPNGPRAPMRSVTVCRDELLTPIGLRSLSPQDPRFQPHHRGSPAERDKAYHQGTVWPWLIGPYVDAAVRAGVAIDGAMGALDEHLRDGGLGSVSETADAVAPHRPSGCPFQAWSVAEVLRARRRVQQLGG